MADCAQALFFCGFVFYEEAGRWSWSVDVRGLLAHFYGARTADSARRCIEYTLYYKLFSTMPQNSIAVLRVGRYLYGSTW